MYQEEIDIGSIKAGETFVFNKRRYRKMKRKQHDIVFAYDLELKNIKPFKNITKVQADQMKLVIEE